MSASLIQKQTKTKTAELAEPTHVGAVVQEYMDSLLVDLFPEIETPVESQEAERETELIAQSVEQVQTVSAVDATPELDTLAVQATHTETQVEIKTDNKVKQESTVKTKLNLSDPLTQVLMQVASLIKNRNKKTAIIEAVPPDENMQTSPAKDIDVKPQVQVKEKTETPINRNTDVTIDVKADVTIESLADVEIPDTQVIDKIDVALPSTTPIQKIETPKAEPLKYPNAPAWAQEAFDVLLFDICGLKLAVPMESLGRIIKMEHETNQLIGRPDWFLGAYTDADQHFYAVDTAAYIMPEQNIDLTIEDFGFLIQLQKTKWTLACQQVHTTVRLEPGDVKWRSQQGWFAGTLVEHMCTLLHVDSLVDTLEADSL